MIFKVETPWGDETSAKEKYPDFKIFIQDKRACIQIDSLEELLRFQSKIGYPLIIEDDWIEIYDDMRE